MTETREGSICEGPAAKQIWTKLRDFNDTNKDGLRRSLFGPFDILMACLGHISEPGTPVTKVVLQAVQNNRRITMTQSRFMFAIVLSLSLIGIAAAQTPLQERINWPTAKDQPGLPVRE